MSSTITASTLTVNITETVSLNGRDQGAENTLTVANVNEIFKRIITVPTSEIGIYTTTDSVAGGSQFKDGRVVYVRLTNKDDTNYILVVVKNSANDEFVIKLGAGESWMSHIQDTCMNADNGPIGTVTSGLANIDTVTAIANTASSDLEVFIASI
jgi:hypothetical protein